MDCSPPGSSVHGIFHGICHFLLQGIFLTRGSNSSLLCLLPCQADSLLLSQLGSPKIGMLSCFGHVRLCVILWTAATRLFCPWGSLGKSTEVGCCALLQGELPHPGIKPVSLMSQALTGEIFTTSSTWEAPQRGKLWGKYRCKCTLKEIQLLAKLVRVTFED